MRLPWDMTRAPEDQTRGPVPVRILRALPVGIGHEPRNGITDPPAPIIETVTGYAPVLETRI